MRILGIDPGLVTTGFGAIAVDRGRASLIEAGIVRPKRDRSLELRLRELFEGVRDVIATSRPDVLAVEEIWAGARDPSSALVIGHARGVLCLAAALADVPVVHIAHSSVKRALTGSGAARKEQVKRMVMTELRLKTVPEPDDVSDALAVALAQMNLHARRDVFAAAGR